MGWIYPVGCCLLISVLKHNQIISLSSQNSMNSFLLLCNNYHKLSRLKQHPFIILSSVDHKSRRAYLDSLLRVLRGWNQGELFYRRSGKESVPKLILAVDRSQCLAIVGLKFPFPCWLLARKHSGLLEAACIPCLVAPSSEPAKVHSNLMLWSSLISLSATSWDKLCF